MVSWSPRAAQLARRIGTDLSPVGAGRWLLFLSGAVVLLTSPALEPSDGEWATIALISAVMALVLLSTFGLPWARLSPLAGLLFPSTVMVALAGLGAGTPSHIGSPYVSLFVLCFAYVGLYQTWQAGLFLLVPAVPTYLLAINRWDSSVAIRLFVGSAVWVALCAVLATLAQRQRQATTLLERAALVDALTGVGNRRALEERLAGVGVGDTVVVCDLDHFKAVNDNLGHAAGDAVLRAFGATLTGCLRGDDYAGRYGGEEFVLILADTEEDEAAEVLARLRRRWRVAAEGVVAGITFSAGYRGHRPGAAAAQTLAAADGALYRAKSGGRDRAVAAGAEPVDRFDAQLAVLLGGHRPH